jgi:Cu/Zn superoxide dismutase
MKIIIFLNPALHTSLLATATALCLTQCKKSNPPAPSDPCLNKAFSISTTQTSSNPCGTVGTGSITVTASSTGSTSFTYSLNGGAFQATNSFSGLATGSYSIVLKDNNNCTSASQNATVAAIAAGPTFTAVKTLMTTRCGLGNNNCHNGTNTARPNFTVDCNIASVSTRIEARAVTAGTMPPVAAGGPLNANDKAIISAWITAGGMFGN